MAYRHYNRGLIWRLFIMVTLALSIGLAMGYSWYWEVIIMLGIMQLISIISFIYFLNQTHRKIHYFIKAVKNEDTTLLFPKNTGNAMLNELHASLNELNQIIQEKNIRNRMNEQYFSQILHHIGTAVVVFTEKGFVMNTNQAALNLFDLHTFTHISQLEKVDPGMKKVFLHIGEYNGKSCIMKKRNDSMQLSVRSSMIRLREESVYLATLQDIRGELEHKELDSWLKLIKVLNHEIMNSLTPVTSIAQSLGAAWQNRTAEPNAALVDHTVNGLHVIGERGEALMRFVQSYRMFSRMPEIRQTYISMCAFFDRLSILTSPLKDEHRVQIRFVQPTSDFSVQMDEQLMVQVIINLVKNAIQAMDGIPEPVVEIRCKAVYGRSAEITVTDKGCGIPEAIREEIFVPFFTTKADGTGIGLSYSRQILRAHGGSIDYQSVPGKTEFLVRW